MDAGSSCSFAFLWPEREAVGHEGFQKYVLSLPFDSCGRNKNLSKADREDKIPYLNRRAKEVEYESLHH